MIVNCQICGKEFYIRPSRIKKGAGKYCSRACQGISKRAKENQTCIVCGKKFYVLPYLIRKGKGRYCSRQCLGKARVKGRKIKCLICGKEFYVKQNRIDLGQVKYCSRVCFAKSQKGRYVTPEHRKKLSNANRGKRRSKEVTEQMRVKSSRQWAGYSEKDKNKIRKSCKDRMILRWASYSEEKRNELIKKIRPHAKPNKKEIELDLLLSKLLPGEYKFVGDGEFILAGKCPDFMNVNGQKKLIEMYGDYWHRNDDPQDRIDLFRQYGYDTLVVWEKELKNLGLLKNKLLSFNTGV